MPFIIRQTRRLGDGLWRVTTAIAAPACTIPGQNLANCDAPAVRPLYVGMGNATATPPSRAPTLVAVGDNDDVRIDHAVEMAPLIPNARLATLPGTTHFSIVKRDAWIEPMMDALTRPSL